MRCKNGLEKLNDEGKAALAKITPNEWLCLSTFRIWQAEEILKVFPENYLQSDARSTATDLFKKTVDALRSNELSKEDAKNAVEGVIKQKTGLNIPLNKDSLKQKVEDIKDRVIDNAKDKIAEMRQKCSRTRKLRRTEYPTTHHVLIQ